MTEKIAKDVVTLFQSMEQQKGDVQLRSIKVALPVGCDVEAVAKNIEANYPMYKAHSKPQEKEQPVLAIGHR